MAKFDVSNIPLIARDRTDIIRAIFTLYNFYKEGKLGGEIMPEAANPRLDISSKDNFHYFTLPMVTNYRRSSYQLWDGSLKSWNDEETRFIFDPDKVVCVSDDVLRDALRKYKVALQPIQHVYAWKTLCRTLVDNFNGDIRFLFQSEDYDIPKILNLIQKDMKKSFPRISGQKIANYWLYVMTQYTDGGFKNRCHLSVAPDTHVIKGSIVLGLVRPDCKDIPTVVAESWKDILIDTQLCPIDMHYPLWLWSRNNFSPKVYNNQYVEEQSIQMPLWSDT